jgi:DNA-binding NtrC family response regulator
MTEGKGKILFADDDYAPRLIFGTLLRNNFSDFDIEEFKDGTSLEKRLNENIEGVKVVITDNSMPGINGSEIITKYAKKPGYENVNFILLYFGANAIGDVAKKEYGAFDYISKGSDRDIFLGTVRKALEEK